MRVIIEKVLPGAKGIWTAEIDPQRLIKLANPVRQGGRLSVVMVNHPSYQESESSLQFDLDSAFLLNLGNTSVTIILDSGESDTALPEIEPILGLQSNPPGDRRYIKELDKLPDTQRRVGIELLRQIRAKYVGELKLKESGRFVESPDNFWTIKIQPHRNNLCIIVYGCAEEHMKFKKYKSFELKNDRSPFSIFRIHELHQIPEAVEVVLEAKRLKDSKKYGGK